MEFKEILDRALERLDDSYSKRPDSPIYTNTAPSAYIVADLYKYVDTEKLQRFATTATGQALDNICYEVGVERFVASKTIIKAEFLNGLDVRMDVPLGSRVAIEDIIFVATEKEDAGIYLMESEAVGEQTSYVWGDIIAVDNIPNLASIHYLELIEAGLDAETDDSLRERYHIRVREPATSGNVYHYKLWAREVQGVGDARVFPLATGPGTVTILIVNTDMELPTEELLQKTANYIETVRPIGATVTVSAPAAKDIAVTAQVTLAAGADILNVQNSAKKALKDYFKSIIFVEDATYVSYALVGSLLLNVSGVLDYAELQLNNAKANIELLPTEIPVLVDAELEE